MKINPKITETAKEATVAVAVVVVGEIAKGVAQVVGSLVRRGTEALSNRIQALKVKQQEKK